MKSTVRSGWRQLYPFDSHFHVLDNHRYHYVDEGSGTPLLMVHGNPTWSFYWRNLIQGLRDCHRCIAPDHIGCGLSDKPQRGEYSYSLDQRITDLVNLVEALDLSEITLLAHDWGGAIGLGAALRVPERFSRIVLFNTGAFPPPFVPLRIRVCRTPMLGTIAIRGLNLFARAAIHMAVEKSENMTSDVRAGLLAPYDSWRNRIAIDQFIRDIPFTRWHPTWNTLTDIEHRLPTLADRPVQMIWGMRDWCFRPSCLDRLQVAFPNAGVHRFEHAGHYVVEDAADEIIPIVSGFLEATPASP